MASAIALIAAFMPGRAITAPADALQWRDPGFDVKRYDADVRIDHAANIAGSAVITFDFKDESKGEFYFHLQDIAVDSLYLIDFKIGAEPAKDLRIGQPAKVVDPNNAKVYYYMAKLPISGAKSNVKLRVFYHGKMTGEAGGFGGVATKDGVIYSMGVGFTTPYVSMTRHWLPCYDHPSDKAAFHIVFRTPSDLYAAASGSLISKESSPEGLKFEYMMEEPCATYLYSFSLAPYALYQTDFNGLPFTAYYYKDGYTEDEIKFAFKHVGDMIGAYEELYGKYPFSSFAYATTPTGSMEHQTMVSLDYLVLNQVKQLKDSVHSVIAHELSHQWWGDLSTPLDFRDAWLNEAMASYSEAAFYDKFYGKEAYLKWVESFNSEYKFALTQESPMPLYDFQSVSQKSNYPWTIYKKGGSVMALLRYYAGDTAFYGALRSFLDSSKYGNFTTAKLLESFNAHTGKDFTWFFDEWIYRKGYPMLRINARGGEPDNDGGRTVNAIILEQTQDTTWGFYTRLPVRIKLEFTDGSDPQYLNFELNKWSEEFVLPPYLTKPVKKISFAPRPEVKPFYTSPLPMRWLSSPEETQAARDLKVIPNPAGEEFALSFESVAQTAEVSIYDISGALIDQRNYAASVGHNSLNMRYVLPAGVYIINLRQGERQISAFLVKK